MEGNHEVSRLPEEHLLLAATLAVEKAREFFQLDPKWSIHVGVTRFDDPATRGQCHIRPEYFTAYIELSEDVDSLEDAYAVGAHEAAHVALAMWHEYADIRELDRGDSFPAVFRIPLEKTTVLLEQLFLQAHPYSDQLASTLAVE